MDGSATKSSTGLLEQARDAIRAQKWNSALTLIGEADRQNALDPDDLVHAAVAAHLIGDDLECWDYLKRAHQGFLRQANTAAAARCAFWLSLWTLFGGDSAQAGGWFARCRRLLDDGNHECVEDGYMLVLEGVNAIFKGDIYTANARFVGAVAIAHRFRDADLAAFAMQGEGRTLIRLGELDRGVSLLDEAMIGVMSGEVSPMAAGGIYCSVLEACGEIYDLRRAQEWTNALERWCAPQPDISPYRGHCLIRRSEILEWNGAWSEALEEADRACAKLSLPAPRPALNAALFRVGELRRLRGEFAEAESAYRSASALSRVPHPGLALLRLDQGDAEGAYAMIAPLLSEVHSLHLRPRLLDAFVEIAIPAGRVSEARAAAEELEQCASQLHAVLLQAISARATGSVRLAEGDPAAALGFLRSSLKDWQELKAPYHSARVRVLIGRVYDQQGNRDAAKLEFESARTVFTELGATADLERLRALISSETKKTGPLTAREVEVLRLVSSGVTNREIAARLHISEKTVARHLSNIFLKLDLPSRAAATAYAYEHRLI
jgi:DNA-binding CsgD family transcriptional regulator